MTAALGLPVCARADSTARMEAYESGRATTRATASLRRGINFGDAMEAPNEGGWGWKLSAAAFRIVKEAGFDHVRVPMRISAHADSKAPYEISRRFLSRMDWVIDQALSRDLGVVIDMHHYEELMDAPQVHAGRLVELWRQVATRYRKLPTAVVYEILNEPTHNLTAEVWNPILARAIKTIRAIDSDRILIIEGANWASAKDLRDTLRFPADDKNLVGSFHMYAPNYFTHQGAKWMDAHFGTRGVVFPGPPAIALVPIVAARKHPESSEFFKRYNGEPADGNPAGPAAIIDQMELAQAFAERTGLRVYLGEFGSIIQADLGSREHWTRMVRTEAERRGFGWAYWDFCRNFAARTRCGSGGRWIPELKAALLE
jgi:endoglucanase